MESLSILNISGFVERSRVNGPGTRFVLWAQGCSIGCKECFNPHTWDASPKNLISVNDMAKKILDTPGIDGVSFTGGEPFEQASALANLGHLLWQKELTVVTFTGYTLEQLKQENREDWNALLACTDLLIDGPYLHALETNVLWRGSSNQKLHFLTDRLAHQTENYPEGERQVEVHISPDGKVLVTGFPEMPFEL